MSGNDELVNKNMGRTSTAENAHRRIQTPVCESVSTDVNHAYDVGSPDDLTVDLNRIRKSIASRAEFRG
jgi:hypothetical protein